MGCAPPAQPSLEELLAEVDALDAAGDQRGAAFALRRAMAQAPEAPALHLRLARRELAAGRADLAVASIARARELGADAQELLVLTARAHYTAGALGPLTSLDPGAGGAVSARTRFLVRALQARALAEDALTPQDAVFDAFFALHPLRQAVAGGDREGQAMLEALDALESSHPGARQARAHRDCAAGAAPIVHRWTPMRVDDARPRLRVGPERRFQRIADAAAAARDGDVIEIDAGDYPGDVAVFRQNDLLVRGVGGRPHIMAAGRRVAQRDAWLFTGHDVVVENVEISGARSPKYTNGASIRHTGRNLTLRHVYLHHSEHGLLTGNRHPDSRILIEHSEFAWNRDPTGWAHNIYIGVSGEAVVRYSYSHHAAVGHLLKSRAARTVLAYSRLSDESGNASYLIDLPYGGDVTIIGNVLEKGVAAENRYVISFGGEDDFHDEHQLRVIHNTIYNRRIRAIAVHQFLPAPTRVVNNLVAGVPIGLVESEHRETVTRRSNYTGEDPALADAIAFDFTPRFPSPVVDRGSEVAPAALNEYVHPLAWRERQRVHLPDIGAYELCRGRAAGDAGTLATDAALPLSTPTSGPDGVSAPSPALSPAASAPDTTRRD